jgi:hypothetical protein
MNCYAQKQKTLINFNKYLTTQEINLKKKQTALWRLMVQTLCCVYISSLTKLNSNKNNN